MVLIWYIWSEGEIEELGVNGAFLLVSILDLTAKVDAEHTINGHVHVDCATYAMLWWTHSTLHVEGVLVRRRAIIRRHVVANESEMRLKMTYGQNALTQYFYVA